MTVHYLANASPSGSCFHRMTHFCVLIAVLIPFGCAQDSRVEGGLYSDLDMAIQEGTFRQITSVLVASDGELIYERYWEGGGPEQLNDTRSATKSLTALAVGAAIADGHIDNVNSPAFDFFEQERPYRFPTTLKDEITIKDLLTMSSALDCDDNVRESPGNEGHMYSARKWLYFVLDMPTAENYQRDENGYGPFHYCTAGSFFLGQIVERASGESIDAFTERRILEPLGIRQVSWDKSPSGEIQTGGGTELTSRSLLALGEMVRNGGIHEGQRVLSAEWIDEMLYPHVSANADQNYGYQWWHRNFACGDDTVSGWYMAGNGGNKIVVIAELDLTLVITATLYSTNGMHQQTTDIVEDYLLQERPGCSGHLAMRISPTLCAVPVRVSLAERESHQEDHICP